MKCIRSFHTRLIACSVILALESACLAADPAQEPAAPHSQKKGACIPLRHDDSRVAWLRALNVAWYYNWASAPGVKDAPKDIPFIPMIWGRRSVLDDDPAIIHVFKQQGAEGQVHTLLGFNEPDGKKQANMSVEEAIALWPKLMKTGLRLGSPAAVNAVGQWMQQFIEQAEARKFRVDFVAVHWYGWPNAESLVNYLEKVHRMYQRPLWLTEFAVADWKAKTLAENRFKPEQILKFMKEVLPRLEQLPFVEAYAWFPGRPGDAHIGPSGLFDEDGNLTSLGKVYASF